MYTNTIQALNINRFYNFDRIDWIDWIIFWLRYHAHNKLKLQARSRFRCTLNLQLWGMHLYFLDHRLVYWLIYFKKRCSVIFFDERARGVWVLVQFEHRLGLGFKNLIQENMLICFLNRALWTNKYHRIDCFQFFALPKTTFIFLFFNIVFSKSRDCK